MKISEINRFLSELTKKDIKFLKNYIGGCEEGVSKDVILSSIEKAIELNKKRKYTHVDIEMFSLTYPESIELFKDYFECFLGNCDTKILRKEARFERKFGLLVYAPLIVDDIDNLDLYIDKLGSDKKEMTRVLEFYNKEVNNENILLKEMLAEKRKTFTLIKRYVFNYDITKNNFCKKFNVSEEVFDECMSLFDSDGTVSCKLSVNEKEYTYLKKLTDDVPEYLVTGMDLDGEKINFTILDYYSLTNLIPRRFKNIYRENVTREDFIFYDKVLATFFSKNEDLGAILKREDLINMNIRFFCDDDIKSVDWKVTDEIFGLFEENNIPSKHVLLEIAIRRYFNSQPILPFKEENDKKNSNIFIKK